jgi:ABC-type transport system involved in cytochrome bd biosynthesis fused ATPase/permease subunit
VPRAVLALAVPALLLAWIARLNLLSAALAGLALAFGAAVATLIGLDTAGAVRCRLESIERLGDRFAALVAGLGLLRAFDRAADHQRSVAESGDEVRIATLATLRLALLTGLVLEIMTAVGTALVAVPLGLRLDSGARILPQALAILMITPEVFLPLRRAAADFHAGASGRTTLARLSQLGAEAITVPAKSMQPGAEPPPHALGIVLEGVRLTAAGHRRPVLDGIDLRVRAGERLCVIGDSGAGKSSLLRVAAGLVTPTAGHAYLEGPSNTACRCPVLGWVPQHPTVLPATVLDNVALGRPGISAATARDALDAAQLGPWLTRLPLGMDTRLTELDAPISLGERRRLAIARVLAGSQVGLWLLDEPTVGLDSATAGSMLTELRQVIGAATALIATHDPAALVLGQRVIQLDRGRLLAGHPQGAPPEPGSHFRPERPVSGTA